MKKALSLLMTIALTAGIVTGCGAAKNESLYKDGTYKAAATKFDDHGWKPQIEVGIKDGKISEVKFDYVNEEGKLKTQDEEYNKIMKDKCGTNPEEFSPELAKRLVDAQELEKVDTVTGATHSTGNFKKLAEAALENAKEGKTEEVVVDMGE